jgi:hypothetical protein
MAVVKDYMDGNCRIVIYDDYCVKTQKEVDEIIATVARIYRRYFTEKALKEMEH